MPKNWQPIGIHRRVITARLNRNRKVCIEGEAIVEIDQAVVERLILKASNIDSTSYQAQEGSIRVRWQPLRQIEEGDPK